MNASTMNIRAGQLIFLRVWLRHRGEFRCRMILDTGARFTILHPELARKIGLATREIPDARLVGVATCEELSMGAVDSVSLLGHVLPNVQVVCYPIHPRLGVDGILGMNVLQHFDYSVDNTNETFTASRAVPPGSGPSGPPVT